MLRHGRWKALRPTFNGALCVVATAGASSILGDALINEAECVALKIVIDNGAYSLSFLADHGATIGFSFAPS
jgi:hypothetical protein